MGRKKLQPIQIRSARLADTEELVAMWNEFAREHRRMVMQKTKPFGTFYTKRGDAAEMVERYFRKNIRSRNSAVYLAETDGTPVGYLLILIRKNPPVFIIDRIGYIDSLYVRKPFRAAGLSSRFKEIAVDWFRGKGLTHMSLNVAPENSHAHAIYKGWGFLDFQIEMRMKI